MTFKGFDLTPLLGALLTIVGTVLSWAAMRVSGAVTKEKNAQAALIRVGAVVTAMLGRAWETLSPQIQTAIADGKITAEERSALEVAVRSTLRGFIADDELTKLAEALGLPLPGLIAKIASMVLDQFAKAHDPSNSEVSALAFPTSDDVATRVAGG